MKQNLANDQKFNQRIADYYQRAIDQINRTIDENANLIVDEKGNHTGYQPVTAGQMASYQREAKHVVQQANQMRAEGKTPTYGDWTDAANNRMQVYNATMRINRLELLKSQVGLHLTEATTETDKTLTAKLSDDYIKECKRQAGIMEVTAQPSMWTGPKVAKIVMAQTNSATFSDRLWANQDALKARLDAVISNGVIQGQSPRKVAKLLKSQVKTTVTNQRYVTERIARTESARVQFSAQIDSIKANGYEYVQWFAEIKACPECAAIERKDSGYGPGVYKISKVPEIPVHPNCRCSISETVLDEEFNPPDKSKFVRFEDMSSNDRDKIIMRCMDWFGTLSKAERHSVYRYTDDAYGYINKYLRTENPSIKNIADNDEWGEESFNVRNALQQNASSQSYKTYRTVEDDEYKIWLSQADGKTHTTDSFKSTTLDKSMVMDKDESYEDENVLQFFIPKGSHVAYLDPISQYPGEEEILIDYKQKYHVIKGKEGLEVYLDE